MIKFKEVSICYTDPNDGSEIYLCKDVNLSVDKGEFVTIMGPSGCGKSTWLSAIVGNLSDYFTLSGDIQIDGESMLGIPIEKRSVGIMFQEALLFPHMNVEQNLLFAVPSKIAKKEKLEKINHWLSIAGLEGINKAHVDTLSGGEASRIALLRTLLSEPQVILLDEPFSKLDEHLKTEFRCWVFEIIQSHYIPTIQVTHNVEDAVEGDIIQFQDL